MAFPSTGNLVTDPSSILDYFFPPPKLIGDIQIDVLVSESPSYDFKVTKHTIETGANIVDHRKENPLVLSLSCIFTNTEFSLQNVATTLATDAVFESNTWRDKKDALYELMDKQEVITVVTPLDTYESMLITKITPSVSGPSQGDSFHCTINLEKAIFVSSKFATIDPSQVPVEVQQLETLESKEAGKRQKKKQDKGEQKTEKDSGKKASILSNLISGLTG